jgi:hypothetical protein
MVAFMVLLGIEQRLGKPETSPFTYPAHSHQDPFKGVDDTL